MIESHRSTDSENWSRPLPEEVPRPTYFPILLALACVFILFGVVTLWLMSAVGAVLFVIALCGWIGELRHDQRTHAGN